MFKDIALLNAVYCFIKLPLYRAEDGFGGVYRNKFKYSGNICKVLL